MIKALCKAELYEETLKSEMCTLNTAFVGKLNLEKDNALKAE